MANETLTLFPKDTFRHNYVAEVPDSDKSLYEWISSLVPGDERFLALHQDRHPNKIIIPLARSLVTTFPDAPNIQVIASNLLANTPPNGLVTTIIRAQGALGVSAARRSPDTSNSMDVTILAIVADNLNTTKGVPTALGLLASLAYHARLLEVERLCYTLPPTFQSSEQNPHNLDTYLLTTGWTNPEENPGFFTKQI